MDPVEFHDLKENLPPGYIFYDNNPDRKELNFYVKKNGLQVFVTQQSPIEIIILNEGVQVDRRKFGGSDAARHIALTYVLKAVKNYESNL